MPNKGVTRREALKATAVFGGGAAVGYLAKDSQQQPDQMIGGGGDGPSRGDMLTIGGGVSIGVEELRWYSGIRWQDGGSLVLEEGDSIGLLETEV